MAETKSAVFESHNPATGEVIKSYPQASEAEVRAEVTAARIASASWRNLGFRGRRKVLLKWSDYLLAHVDELTAIVSN